ncbi:hypothetical protein [Hydrogenibacillus sp. N12]|nr:hypothetical protein [Hydrogenibacillus sp. N12]QZA33183.1 hypothetical protein K2M58_01020 [Hydrogenibacillus sp. N12]
MCGPATAFQNKAALSPERSRKAMMDLWMALLSLVWFGLFLGLIRYADRA